MRRPPCKLTDEDRCHGGDVVVFIDICIIAVMDRFLPCAAVGGQLSSWHQISVARISLVRCSLPMLCCVVLCFGCACSQGDEFRGAY